MSATARKTNKGVVASAGKNTAELEQMFKKLSVEK